MTPSERLLDRLRAMGLDIPAEAHIRRTYAGYWQRLGGAWSWFVDGYTRGEGELGSYERVTDLVAAERLTVEQSRSKSWVVSSG